MSKKPTYVITPKFRVSYPNVFQPKMNELSKKLEYCIVALFPKSADLTQLREAANLVGQAKWGVNEKKWPTFRYPTFREHNERVEKDDEGNLKKRADGSLVLPDGYEEGAFYLNLKSTQPPTVVDEFKQEIIEPQKFYAGCWAKACLQPFAYSQAGNNGISFGLIGLMKVADSDPLTGRPKPSDMFSSVSDFAAENLI